MNDTRKNCASLLKQRGLPIILFDFDETLAPCASTGVIHQMGETPTTFFQSLHDSGLPDISSFNEKLIRRSRGRITKASLRQVGRSLKVFPGVTGFLRSIHAYCRIGVLTCGSLELVLSTSIAGYLNYALGSEFYYASNTQAIKGIKKTITPDDKGKFIRVLAESFPEASFAYIGDGLTDRSAWDTVKSVGGIAVAVSSEGTFEDRIYPGSADYLFERNFEKGSSLRHFLYGWLEANLEKEKVYDIW